MNAITQVSSAETEGPSDDRSVVVIGEIGNDLSHKLFLQDFVSEDGNFVPIFSDVGRFLEQTTGTGLERRGLIIRKDLLAEVLRGDEILILDPGSDNPQRITKADLI